MVWQKKPLNYIILAVVVLFLSVAQLKSIVTHFGDKLGPQIQAAQGVVEGLPHWRLYQSRVLGPYMVHAAKNLTGWSFQQAYALMMLVWLIIFFTVLIAVSISIWQSSLIAIGIAASAAFINSTLMQGIWLYPWDYIDLTLFTLLIWAVLTRKPLKVIALIVAVEIFNREAATIVAGWLVLDALLEVTLRKKGASSEQIGAAKRQLMLGAGLAVVSMITVEALRATLLVREIGPEIFGDVKSTGPLFEVQLMGNLSNYVEAFSHLTSMMVIYNILIAAIAVLCIVGMRSADREVSRLSLLFLILWCFTFTFGLIYETRVWLAFVPYLVLVVPRLMTAPAPTASSLPAAGVSTPASPQ